MPLRLTRSVLMNPVETILAVLMVLITVDVLAAVVFRYVLQMPLGFYDELARFLFIWVAFLGAVVGVRRRGHFAIHLLGHRLPARLLRALSLLIYLGTLAFAGLLVEEGIKIVQLTSPQLSPAMEISMAYLYAVLPVSGGLMIMYLIPQIAQELRGQN